MLCIPLILSILIFASLMLGCAKVVEVPSSGTAETTSAAPFAVQNHRALAAIFVYDPERGIPIERQLGNAACQVPETSVSKEVESFASDLGLMCCSNGTSVACYRLKQTKRRRTSGTRSVDEDIRT